MIGIIPSNTKTFEVHGDFNSSELVEGHLYYRPEDQRLFYYSTVDTRSNPSNGYFPIWDGKQVYITRFSNKKYLKDMISTDINQMCSKIDGEIAAQVRYNQRRSDNDELLKPALTDGDNLFTQCIKGVICKKEITMIDLIDMSCPPLTQKVIENTYASLMKITFMRMDKWNIWIDVILKLSYRISVFKGTKLLVVYSHPEETYATGVVNYNNIGSKKDDPLKRIVMIIMVMEGITKASLKSPEVDDYTINNMMTTINGSKTLSAQLFSRFIRMANLSYKLTMFEGGKPIFEFRE